MRHMVPKGFYVAWVQASQIGRAVVHVWQSDSVALEHWVGMQPGPEG